MNNVPIFYDHMNAANWSLSPGVVHSANTELTNYFRRYLLQRAMSVFKWTLPAAWSKDYFLYTLYCYGHIAIVKTDKYGVIPQACGLRGYDVFYRPTNAIITNPLLTGILEPRIGTDCTVLKLQPDYGGIMDIVSYYADLMSVSAETAGINIVNSKLSYVFTAANKSAAESFKRLYDDVASGKPAVVQDKSLLNADGTPAWSTFSQNLRENYIANQILADMRTYLSQFDTEIGIKNVSTEKRERLVVDEVNANSEETRCLADLWLEMLQEDIDKTNLLFGEDLISVSWRYEGGAVDAGRENIDSGAI